MMEKDWSSLFDERGNFIFKLKIKNLNICSIKF